MSADRGVRGNGRRNRRWAGRLLADPKAIPCRMSLLLSKRG